MRPSRPAAANSMSSISERDQLDAFAGIVGLVGETVDEVYADGEEPPSIAGQPPSPRYSSM